MKTLVNNYYGTSGQNGTSGGSGGPGVYALNIGGPKTGGGHYLPPGGYATGASVEIKGGAGGYGGTGITSVNGGAGGGGGAGGMGVLLGGGTLSNSGTISGGAGGYGGYGYFSGTGLDGSPGGTGGAGGVGVDFTSGAKLTNHTGGNITGGAGGHGGVGGLYGGLGGVGGSGGVGVSLGAGTLTNATGITGGAGGAGGFAGRPPEENNGGGPGIGGEGGGGAAGVTLAGGVLTNNNAITGGTGGAGGAGAGELGHEGSGGAGAAGGSGAYLLGGTLTNHGSITGGVGGAGGPGYQEGVGGSGGTGVLLNGGNVITTSSISGGTGGAAGYDSLAIISAAGGGGGAGVTELSGTLTNLGSITGGGGGGGGYAYVHSGGAGGSGGAGVSLSGGTLTTSGTVSGGNGGTGGGGNLGLNGEYPGTGGAGGNGGAGAYLNGGTLTTSGTISGGAGGVGGSGATNGAAGAAGDAVQFGSVASTLVVKPGAVFNGQVAANASVNDVLKLSGVQSGGTPITLGTQFTNFSTLTFAAGADWTVDAGTGAAPSSGLAITGFTTTDTIDVTNLTPAQVQADFNPSTHTLTTTSDGTLHFVSVPFNGESFLFSNDGGGGTDMTVVVGSAISSVLTSTVTLGSSAYKSPLTISNAGGVTPSAPGATGLVSSHSTNSLTNNGTIQGGTGAAAAGNGGFGVNLTAGTVTNTGSITGGAGGKGSTTGGHGGAGVELNGGTLITSGTISGGVGGAGTPVGGSGDAVQFGTAASTLIVDPGAVFNGQVVGNASVHDVLEVSGTQAGGTPITLGTQFTNFSTLKFATGATGSVDATKSDLMAPHTMLTIDGFALGDTLDITNLKHSGTAASFDATKEILTITQGATVIELGFNSAFTGEHFVLASNGHGGTDVTLQTGAASEPMALHGFSSHAFTDHGLAHDASVMMS
jgi:hypothetical protein